MKNELNVLSLFSGCGGMDLGFEGDFEILKKSINLNQNSHWEISQTQRDGWIKLPKTRFHTVFANDILKEARTAWQTFFSKKGIDKNIYHLESIVEVVKNHKNGESVLPMDLNIDVVTGGFPCQDFSVSGKRKGFKSHKSHDGKMIINEISSVENRGQLYMWLKEIVSITKPKLFIAENVKGLVSLSDVKQIIENDFRAIANAGYIVVEGKVLHAADYGIAQSRERVFFFGFKKSALKDEAIVQLTKNIIPQEYNPFPQRTHLYTPITPFDKSEALMPFVTVKDCFLGLEEPEFSKDLAQKSYSKAKFMGKHCQGQNEVNLSGIAPTIRAEHHGNIEYRRLSIENGGKNFDELDFGLLERRLTVRECARIQTFPDDYDFVFKSKDKGQSLSASAAYKVIGNAVPPLLAFHIAKNLEDKWDKYFI
ncbi:MAG: DNA (cytosine-5-)-methyltransferase [Clostridia bacterium]